MAKNGFGKLLREAREAAERSMGALARHLGVSVPYLSDVERGNRQPLTDERIRTAAAFLGVDSRPLLKAAAETRGAFQLDAAQVNPQHRQVGAMLARQWGAISDDKLAQIRELLESEEE